MTYANTIETAVLLVILYDIFWHRWNAIQEVKRNEQAEARSIQREEASEKRQIRREREEIIRKHWQELQSNLILLHRVASHLTEQRRFLLENNDSTKPTTRHALEMIANRLPETLAEFDDRWGRVVAQLNVFSSPRDLLALEILKVIEELGKTMKDTQAEVKDETLRTLANFAPRVADKGGLPSDVPEQPVRVVIESTPPSPPKGDEAEKQFDRRIKRGKTILEVLAFLGLVAYVYETRRTNNLTEQALELNRKMFNATQVAGFQCGINQSFPNNGTGMMLQFTCANKGKSAASNVTGEMTVVRSDSGKVVQEERRPINENIVLEGDAIQREFSLTHSYSWDWVSRQDMTASVSLRYGNGLDIVSQSSCWKLFTLRREKSFTFMPCAPFIWMKRNPSNSSLSSVCPTFASQIGAETVRCIPHTAPNAVA